MRMRIVFLSLLLAQGLNAALPPRPVAGDRWAVIAIAPERDSAQARRLATVLTTRYGYEPSKTIELAGSAATAETIRDAIGRLAKLERKPESVLIVIDALPSPKQSGAILVADSNPGEPWTLLQSFEIARLVEAIPIGTVLVVSPGCEDSLLGYVEKGSYFVRTVIQYCARTTELRELTSVSASMARVLEELADKGEPSTARDIVGMLKSNPLLLMRVTSYASSDEFRFRPTSSVVSPYLATIRDTTTPVEVRIDAIDKLIGAVLGEPETTRSRLEQIEAAGAEFAAIAKDTRQPSPVREKAVWAIGVINFTPAVADLERLYASSPPDMQKTFVQAAARMKPPVLTIIRRGVSDDDAAVRVTALQSLTALRDQSAADAAASLLGDRDTEVVVAAIQSLALLREQFTDSEKSAIVALLEHPAPAVRKEAVGVVTSFGAADALRNAFATEQDQAVRAAIAYGIGRVKLDRADERNAVSSALRDVATNGKNPTIVREAAIWAIGQQRFTDSIEAVTSVLRRSDAASLQKAAAEALGNLRADQSVPTLIRSLKSLYPEARMAAAAALGKIGNTTATQPLIDVLNDDNPYVRGAVREALDLLTPTSDAVARLLNSPEPIVRADAARKLAASNPQDAWRIVALLSDKNLAVRDAAFEALAGITTGMPRTSVEQMLDSSDPQIRMTAASLLGRWHQPESANVLLAHLRDPQPQVRAAVLDALWRTMKPAPADVYISASRDEDPGVRLVAAKALSKVESAEASMVLRQLTEDPAPEVRQIAIDALRIRGKT